MIKAYRARITGRVQGVGFRWFTRENAKVFGIKGYVRNLPTGDVEVHAEGEHENLQLFLEILRKGPAFSHVEQAEISSEKLNDNFDDFYIMH